MTRFLSSVPLMLFGISISMASAHEPAKHQHAEALQGVYSLDVAGSGKELHVLMGDYKKDNPKAALLYLRSDDAGETWSKPVRVDEKMPTAHSPHRGMDAQLAVSGDQLIAVWMTSGTDAWGGGPMATSLSKDGGKTWSEGPNPADDNSTDGHGFIDIAGDNKGGFHLTWFDTRDGKRGLRYAGSKDGGKTWSANAIPDDETCECCWNTITTSPDGSVGILYRDKSPRDMSLAISPDSGATWPRSASVGNFDWDFNGCPHVGGGLAIGNTDKGQTFHATIWTGQTDRVGVYHLASSDNAKTWSKPHQLGDVSASHPDVAANAANEIVAVWDARMGEKTGVQGAISKDGGTTWSKSVTLSSPEVTASHPRVLATANGFRVFWTEKGEQTPAIWRSVTFAER